MTQDMKVQNAMYRVLLRLCSNVFDVWRVVLSLAVQESRSHKILFFVWNKMKTLMNLFPPLFLQCASDVLPDTRDVIN
jgi:hypothetical protein